MGLTVLPALIKSAAPPGGGLSIAGIAQNAGAGANPTIPIDLGSVTSDRKIFAVIGHYDSFFGGGYATALTMAGKAMTEVTACRAVQGLGLFFAPQARSQLFWIDDTVETGTTSFAVTAPGSPDDFSLVVYEILGAEAAPIGATKTIQTATNTATIALTTTAAGSLILYGAYGRDMPGTPAAGVTEDYVAGGTALGHWAGSRLAATAGTYTVGATFATDASDGAAAFAAEILAA